MQALLYLALGAALGAALTLIGVKMPASLDRLNASIDKLDTAATASAAALAAASTTAAPTGVPDADVEAAADRVDAITSKLTAGTTPAPVSATVS